MNIGINGRKIGVGVVCGVMVVAAVVLSVLYWPRPSEVLPLNRAALLKTYAAATSGKPVLSDPLRKQDNNQWDIGTWHQGDSCTFHGGAYHIKSVEQEYYSWCIAEGPIYANFAYQVKMTITVGDGGGLVFRSDGKSGNYYYFHVGQDGSYGLSVFVARGQPTDLEKGTSPSIKTGLGQSNLLCVIVRGSDIALYVNGQPLVEANDYAYHTGQIGVVADEDGHTTDVAYSDAQVWVL